MDVGYMDEYGTPVPGFAESISEICWMVPTIMLCVGIIAFVGEHHVTWFTIIVALFVFVISIPIPHWVMTLNLCGENLVRPGSGEPISSNAGSLACGTWSIPLVILIAAVFAFIIDCRR